MKPTKNTRNTSKIDPELTTKEKQQIYRIRKKQKARINPKNFKNSENEADQ